MRPMEYTPVQCRCEPMGHWTLVRWCLIHDAQIEPTKKLTDAECAAEYWAARGEWLQANVRRPPGTDTSPDGDRIRRERVLTTHRFATCPHASEVDQ